MPERKTLKTGDRWALRVAHDCLVAHAAGTPTPWGEDYVQATAKILRKLLQRRPKADAGAKS